MIDIISESYDSVIPSSNHHNNIRCMKLSQRSNHDLRLRLTQELEIVSERISNGTLTTATLAAVAAKLE